MPEPGTMPDAGRSGEHTEPSATPAVRVSHLSRAFGVFRAVDDVSFEVKPGESFGFLGPNGAGKTTTISILCTLLNPTSGGAEVAGYDVVTQRETVRRHIGLVFQDTTLDDYLTADENLRFHGRLYGIARSDLAPRIESVLRMVELWERRDDVVRNFSGGMKRRLEIARGLLHSPRVLFLDEPTIGLDPQTRTHIWGYINELKRQEDITIFLTTHYMDEAEQCDRIAIIDRGRIVVIDTPEALKEQVAMDRVQLHTDDDELAIARLAAQFSITASMSHGFVTFQVAHGEEFVPRLFDTLGVAIKSVSIARPTLDDVFIAFTGRTLRDAESSGADQLRAAPMARAWRR